MDEALPRETKEQWELFMHLNFAYISGRYRSEEEFPVTREHLDYWAMETKKLLEITETVCRVLKKPKFVEQPITGLWIRVCYLGNNLYLRHYYDVKR